MRAVLLRALALLNPLRNPAMLVVAVLTFVEEVGQHDAWFIVAGGAVLNFLALQLLCGLLVSTVGNRRMWHWLLVDRHRPRTTSSSPFLFSGRDRPDRSDWIWHSGNWRPDAATPSLLNTGRPRSPVDSTPSL